jgi:hypothetical protein
MPTSSWKFGRGVQANELGIDVSQATVGRYLPWRPKVPSPTWRSFLHNHMHDTAAVDMFVVVTARFQLLYALVVLGLSEEQSSISKSRKTRGDLMHSAMSYAIWRGWLEVDSESIRVSLTDEGWREVRKTLPSDR